MLTMWKRRDILINVAEGDTIRQKETTAEKTPQRSLKSEFQTQVQNIDSEQTIGT